MLVEKADERALLGIVAPGRLPRRARQDRLAVIEIAREDDRVHVRRATDRRRVPELRAHEPNREHDILLRLAIVGGCAQVGEDGGDAYGAAPCTEVLRRVAHARHAAHVVVHVALGEILPLRAVGVAKELRAGRLEHRAHDRREGAVDDDVLLLLVRLPLEVEGDRVLLDVHVALEQRRDAEGVVLARVALAADAEEALADEAHDGGGDAIARELLPARDLRVERLADAREIAREAAHAIVLALLARGDGALVIAILLAPLHVEAPRLDRRARGRGDVHVAPGGRNLHRVDARELLRVAHRPALRMRVLEARALAAVTRDPLDTHSPQPESKKQSDGIDFRC